ncbi:MAG: hypothetical protein Q8Q09_21160 [Deltaproteobacteria bacterium]|nr:hypothetical protein [Deltaproteobacteria bacterium]
MSFVKWRRIDTDSWRRVTLHGFAVIRRDEAGFHVEEVRGELCWPIARALDSLKRAKRAADDRFSHEWPRAIDESASEWPANHQAHRAS